MSPSVTDRHRLLLSFKKGSPQNLVIKVLNLYYDGTAQINDVMKEALDGFGYKILGYNCDVL